MFCLLEPHPQRPAWLTRAACSVYALAVLGMLGACTAHLAPATSPAAVAPHSATAPTPAIASTSVYNLAAEPSRPLPASASASPLELLSRALADAELVRGMSGSELGAQAARLADATQPLQQWRLALVLGAPRPNIDWPRAQEPLARLLSNTSAEAQTLHPLARLLAARYAEQRRADEQLERQAQQIRDVQRKLELTHERLEALKAIERSLAKRPASSVPATGAPAAAPRP